MHDSLELFNDIVNNEVFSKASMILFFNKKDLFTEKIQRTLIKKAFEDFEGNVDNRILYC